MTRDVPTLPPILECTQNHISRQIENEEKRHVKKFQILGIATNWLTAKGLLLQTDQIMIYLQELQIIAHNLSLFRKTVNAASGNASRVEQVKSGEKYHLVLCSMFYLHFDHVYFHKEEPSKFQFDLPFAFKTICHKINIGPDSSLKNKVSYYYINLRKSIEQLGIFSCFITE